MLDVLAGQVQIMRAGQNTWQGIANGTELKSGDAVRTAEQGSAVLDFYGLARCALAPSSQVKVRDLEPGAVGSPLTLRLDLEAGRAWSRVLRLFGVDDTYSIASSNVVTTVRGTAFDLWRQAQGTQLSVTDSAVEVSGQGSAPTTDLGTPSVVGQGYTVKFDESGKTQNTVALSEELRQSAWFTSNTQNDTVYAKKMQDALTAKLQAMHGISPDSWLDGLARASENLHLAFSGAQAPELYAAYTERRLFAIKNLVEQGKSGAALSALTVLQNDVESKLSGSNSTNYARYLSRAVTEISELLSDAAPTSALYPMKQKLEDLSVTLAGNDELEAIYARLQAISARLDEASVLIGQNSLDDAKNALDAARDGMTNVERDMNQLPDTASHDRVAALRGKLDVLKAREAAYRVRLATALQPPQNSLSAATTTSDLLNGSSSATPGLVAATTTMATSTYDNIELSAAPTNARVGDKVELRVQALMSDGSKTDVTTMTKFSLTGPARLNGPTLVANASGTVEVVATFDAGSDEFVAKLRLPIGAAVAVLQTLKLTVAGTDELGFGARTALTATAVYSDGTTKNVTAATQFSSSNLSLGYMTDNVFNAGQNSTGTVRVVAAYAEAGKSLTAAHEFDIISH